MRIKHLILGIIAALLLTMGIPTARATVRHRRRTDARSSAKAKHPVRKRTVRRRVHRRVRRRRVVRRRIRGQRRPSQDRIEQIQTALAAAGAYHGKVDGMWGSNSEDAMRAFQSSHGLNPTGKINALTLQKLGLGSRVAGRGAPVPVASAAKQGDPKSP